MAILLVFIGHSVRIFPKWTGAGLYSPVHSIMMQSISYIIYTFHMPIFVFISGFLMANSFFGSDRTIFEYVKGRFNRLIIPFYLFGIFWNVPMWTLGGIYLNIPLITKIQLILKGMNNGHLWFLAMLFCLTLIFIAIERLILKKTHVLFGFFIFAPVYFFNITGEHNYYYIYRVNKYIIYYYLGYLFFRYRKEVFGFIEKYSLKIFSLSALVWINMEMKLLLKSSLNQFCLLITAFVAIVCILIICKFLEKRYGNSLSNSYMFNFISINSFLLYAFHEPIMFNILKLIHYGKDFAPLVTVLICFFGTFSLAYLCVITYNKIADKIKTLNFSVKICQDFPEAE